MKTTLLWLLVAAALVAAPTAAADCQDIDGVGSACADADSDPADGTLGADASARSADGSASADASLFVGVQ